MFKVLKNKWKNYRHRFLPWLALNLRHRMVPESHQIKNHGKDCIPKTKIENSLKEMLLALENPCKGTDTALTIFGRDSSKRRQMFEKCGKKNREILMQQFGFNLEIKKSAMPGAGNGVFLNGKLTRGQVAALYPGSIYMPYQPILLPSICNPYVFRCADGCFIDGNYKGISALIFRSIHGRDRIGSRIPICDISWLHLRSIMEDNKTSSESYLSPNNVNINMLTNPLNVGQIVNNANPEIPGCSANLAYYEITLTFGEAETDMFKDYLILGLIPNNYYKKETLNGLEPIVVKVVALVAITDVQHGEELLTTYFTLVDNS